MPKQAKLYTAHLLCNPKFLASLKVDCTIDPIIKVFILIHFGKVPCEGHHRFLMLQLRKNYVGISTWFCNKPATNPTKRLCLLPPNYSALHSREIHLWNPLCKSFILSNFERAGCVGQPWLWVNIKRYLINYPHLFDYGQTIFCLSFSSLTKQPHQGDMNNPTSTSKC